MTNDIKVNTLNVNIQKLNSFGDLELPKYETLTAAGLDLRCVHDFVIPSGKRTIVSTGICIHIPDGYEAQIRPRSGLAAKYGIAVLNSPGTIDSDYRGEIKVILFNSGEKPFIGTCGDRIAQMVLSPIAQAKFFCVDSLEDTERGSGGFGSTGVE